MPDSKDEKSNINATPIPQPKHTVLGDTPYYNKETINQGSPAKTTRPGQGTVSSRAKSWALFIAGAALLVALGLSAGLYIGDQTQPAASPSLSPADDGNKTITQEESSIATVAEKVGPSVVSIITTTETKSFFGVSSGEAAGTGVIISKDGYVMTNNHVLNSAKSASVIDSTGKQYDDVTLVGRDPLNDIAFLKIESKDSFTPATIGNSSTLRTGQQVVAIGNALGQYSNTVTSGIISGTGRPVTASSGTGQAVETLTDLIQTDASINHGNSGGPLVNMAGQVIGINTAIAEDANGIGFAIPINATKGLIAGVIETGKVSRAQLGVSFLSLTPAIAREQKLSVSTGAYIYSSGGSNAVTPNGPADKAGLERGDVITKINNEVVGKQGALSSILGEYRPGDKINITYIRDGKEVVTSAKLAAYSE